MSLPFRTFGGLRVFDDAGPASARRVYVDAADGWMSRRTALNLAAGAGLSEARTRDVLESAYTTSNAAGWADRNDLTLAQAVLSPDLAALSVGIADARRAKDWQALGDYLQELYGDDDLEFDDDGDSVTRRS